ncbi:DUF3958 family protein [Enterococcus sp. DIV0242_7C1]|uniref:Uncharacterized protein n=1 Tax=Candidatus Enterococcus dunnyi TaxID=1834192 RepID=A0A200JCS1_9ENTE|nr:MULTISPECIES: DUF3958 family protein [unclassified Enterococcus]MBO0469706.1 DUF3958 family protein [Enterococcus sp. DIV0242_7C1]OUZ35006.1 hypothetical protein A5889_000481 [Enterococcus sp. 9D6_DIV0238]
MSEEKKKDSLDEMIMLNRELQTVTDELDKNKKQIEKLEEADDITQQIYKENTDILDELAYYWKGDKANRFLYTAYEENEYDHKRAMNALDKAQYELEQEQKSLVKKEENLVDKQIKLRQESS